MFRLYYCPNCRGTIYSGDHFCGNCGVSLKWVEAQISPANSSIQRQKPVDGQNVCRQQQDYNHQEQRKQTVQYSHNRKTQKPVSINPKTRLKGNTNSSQTAVRDKSKPADDSTELLKNEVAKLLDRFLEKVV